MTPNDSEMTSKARISKNISELKIQLKDAQLVAVTKYSSLEDVVIAYHNEVHDFGENRTSDLTLKAEAFAKAGLADVRWHFIGHLQSNKVRELLKTPNLYAIHSVDSLHLLQELYLREANFTNPILKIFLQVKTSGEEEKDGFKSEEELFEAVALMLSKKESKLKLYGLMTMGPIRTNNFEVDARKSFQNLKLIRQKLYNRFQLSDLKLSMGMSQDYLIALSEGADYIRVGSKIFK